MIIDLHVHTSEVSNCSNVGVCDVIDLYYKKGYDAITVTNHLNDWTIGMDKAGSDYSAFIDSYMAPVKKGKEYAKKYGMKVFFGCELRFCNDPNDYLVYGITEEFLKVTPNIRELGIRNFYRLACENDFLVYQAHPFRNGMRITPPQFLHGIEVANGHRWHEARNDIARIWADTYGLHMISGSDFHEAGDEANGGIISFREVENDRELCALLLSDDFNLITSQKGGLAK